MRTIPRASCRRGTASMPSPASASVAPLYPVRQLNVFEPLAAFDSFPLLAVHVGRVEKSLGAQQATSTNGPPVRGFGEVVDARWKLHLLLRFLYVIAL